MERYNRDIYGNHFSEEVKKAVWDKAYIVPGCDSTKLRKDLCGAWIRWDNFGDTENKYGWEIDHIKPVVKGGGDELSNLQPLQWENNRQKADAYPAFNYAVVSDLKEEIENFVAQ